MVMKIFVTYSTIFREDPIFYTSSTETSFI